MKLYIATSNPGKLRDFAAAAGQDTSLEPLPGLADIPPPPEDAPTFEGNARSKAIYYSLHAPGQIVLADDSGLEVDALAGAPGVRSARYAEDLGFVESGESTDKRNNACLQQALSQVPNSPGSPYTARYRCALAAARDGHLLQTSEGLVEGEITDVPRGTCGFGYDPLFYLPLFQKTMAELAPATRLTFSHRGLALRRLLEAFERSDEPA
jgi:XTP/dITP diphosphohydrolase